MNDTYHNTLRPRLRRFEIVLPAGMHQAMREFLFRDSSREYMGVILAGVSETDRKLKLLGRRFIPVPIDAYEYQSAGGLAVCREYSQELLSQCAEEGLSQIDVHSHPFGPSPHLWFSGTDDAHEQRMAEYIYRRLERSLYASLVMNQGYSKARIWLPYRNGVRNHEISTMVLAESPFRRLHIGRYGNGAEPHLAESDRNRFARQILAFGEEGQLAISQVSMGVVGAGGMGSAIIEGLARLGVRHVTVIDPDVAEISNINRVSGMTLEDGHTRRAKVEIAERTVSSIASNPKVKAIQESVFATASVQCLKDCDIIIAATDNHATRMFAQRIGAQYLIPVVSVGVNIEVAEDASLDDVSGEFAIALPGAAGWCLACARVYDAERAAIELADAVEQKRWIQRGYIDGADVKAPAVSHLNGVVANLALAEIHNLIAPFKEFVSYLTYSQQRNELMPYTISRNQTCAICSDTALLGLGDLEPLPNYEHSLGKPMLFRSDIVTIASVDHRASCLASKHFYDHAARRWLRKAVVVSDWIYLVVVILVWILMRTVGDRWWATTMFIFGPRWILLLPLSILLPSTFFLRRKSLVVVLLLAAITVLIPIMGLTVPYHQAVSVNSGGVRIRVLTCNIHWREFDPLALTRVIAAENPDVVALQEWSPNYDFLFPLPVWHTRRVGELFLASHYPIGEVASASLLEAFPPGEAACFTINTGYGPLNVLNLHLASPHKPFDFALEGSASGHRAIEKNSVLRLTQSGIIRDYINHLGPCVIVAGDFNTPDDSRVFRESWEGLEDAFQTTGWGFGYTYHANGTSIRIDHLLLASGLRSRRCWVGPSIGSPHRPVIAELEWRCGDQTP
jgi:vancomycin resistance protein VanJ